MRRIWTVIASTGLILLAASAAGQPATAGGTWYQSVGRASADAPCPEPTFGTPWQSNWDPDEQPWRPSWGQWMNGGTGGFTCDRSITWARPLYPSGQCQGSGSIWFQFAGGWSYENVYGTWDHYTSSSCTTTTPGAGYQVVYAPPGFDASTLCREAFAITSAPTALGGDVYVCAMLV